MSTTTNSNTDTATVRTLTAEVRVLQVNNRQITQSVYRQLDLVGYPDLEPFGRVRSQHDSAVEIVGREKDSGALVRSRVTNPGSMWSNDPVPGPAAFADWWQHIPDDVQQTMITQGEQESIVVARDDQAGVRIVWRKPLTPHCSGGCAIDRLYDQWQREATRQLNLGRQTVVHRRRWLEANGLPLIVLAGLR